MNVGVLLASGVGQRYGSTIPKQFVKLNGVPVVLYSLKEFIKSNQFKEIIVVINDLSYKYLFDGYGVHVIQGGKTRNHSIKNAIEYAKQFEPYGILFHDAARPLIKAQDFEQYCIQLLSCTSVITAEKITDSLFPSKNRDKFRLIQTPEAFSYKLLEKHFRLNKEFTAIYQHVPAKPFLISLNHPNYKITYPKDLFMLEHLVKYQEYKKNTIASLKYRKVLLLGASGGIGSEVYKQLLKTKATVHAPSSKQLHLGTDKIISFDDIDIIINCAGISYTDKEGILEHYNDIMNVNLKASLEIIEMAKKSNVRPFNIVFISSSSATKGRQNLTVYSASKVALHSIIESQAEELAKKCIYINCICPEKVNTPLAEKLHTDLHKEELLSSEEVAKAIINYSVTTEYGQIINLRKGLTEIC